MPKENLELPPFELKSFNVSQAEELDDPTRVLQLTIQEIMQRAETLQQNEMALKVNLDSMIIPNVPRCIGGHEQSIDSEFSSAT